MMFSFLLILSVPALAEQSAFEQALQHDSGQMVTKESEEIHNGIRYRKIESSQGIFYFKMLELTPQISELECETDFNMNSPAKVTVSVKTFHRSRLFVRRIKERCENYKGQKRMKVDWSAVDIGVQLPSSKKDQIQDKEIHVNPATPGMGFSGSF